MRNWMRTPRSVCFSCRKVFAPMLNRPGAFWLFYPSDRNCPDCGNLMTWKYNFKAPRRNNVKAWKKLSVG